MLCIIYTDSGYKNKYCGFVVDYVGVLKHLKEALAIYADDDIEEICQVVVNIATSKDELKHRHSKIENFFKKYEIDNWLKNFEKCVALLVDTDLKIINFIKESARHRYRDDKLSIKDASNKRNCRGILNIKRSRSKDTTTSVALG